MRFLSKSLCVVVLMASSLMGASAQDAPPPAEKGAPVIDAPASEAPAPETLDALFDALKAAKSAEEADAIANQIWAQWMVAGGDTIDLLVSRALEAFASDDQDLAVQLLDAIIEVDPQFAEGWNKRASIHLMREAYDKALADLTRALQLEPRHFGALVGMGRILEEFGQKRGALEAYRRALAVHPYLEDVQKEIDRLAPEVEGRGI